MAMKYTKTEIISLKNSSEYNEKWLQARIEEDPSVLGLGELEFRYTEKMMVGGGRLDTILYEPDTNRRYEVEIQLGKTDESHIIRTLEYWDIERKRNPQYEHCAVIIAEDITSRFLNVISLFNGYIPFIAIQVKALKIGDNITLFFTKVMDEVRLDMLEEDALSEPTDRNYWEKKVGKKQMTFIDNLYSLIAEEIGDYKMKYNKFYIGLEKNGMANNFISFKPHMKSVVLKIKLEKTQDVDDLLEESGIEMLPYEKQWRQYRLKFFEGQKLEDLSLVKKLVAQAKSEKMG